MNARESITCKELTDFLMDYIDGELDAPRRELFDQHLKICPSCVRYLASYRRTVQLGQEAFSNDLPKDSPDSPNAPPGKHVPEGLIKAILAARRV